MWQYTYAFAVTGFVVLWLSLLDISMLVIMYCHVVICYPSLVLRLSINSVLTVYRNEGKAGEILFHEWYHCLPTYSLTGKGVGPSDLDVLSVHQTEVPNVCKVKIMASRHMFSWLEMAKRFVNETDIFQIWANFWRTLEFWQHASHADLSVLTNSSHLR